MDGETEVIHNVGDCGRVLGADEEVAWGCMLADAVYEIAESCGFQYGTDKVEAARRIMKNAEIELRAKLARTS